MALTLLFFALAERYPERRRLFLVLMYASVGLGMLTKGPIAALLPGLAFAIYLAAHRELGRVRDMLIPLGSVDRAGDRRALVRGALSAGGLGANQVVLPRRERRSLRGRRRRECRAPVLVVPARCLQRLVPVVDLSLPSRSSVVPRASAAIPAERRLSASGRCSGSGFVVIVGFFSLSAGKQDLYIYPIVPAIVALAGIVIDSRARRARGRGRPRIGLVTAA